MNQADIIREQAATAVAVEIRQRLTDGKLPCANCVMFIPSPDLKQEVDPQPEIDPIDGSRWTSGAKVLGLCSVGGVFRRVVDTNSVRHYTQMETTRLAKSLDNTVIPDDCPVLEAYSQAVQKDPKILTFTMPARVNTRA